MRPDSAILYLDRNIGSKIVPAILKARGIPFEIHAHHLVHDAPDEESIELCSKNGWIAITKDASGVLAVTNPLIKNKSRDYYRVRS